MLTEKNGHAHAWPFSSAMRCRIVLNVIFLTEKFYRRYEDCPEIEQKTSRPYIRVGVLIDGVLWAIPMRSNITHEHTIWTDKANKCGIDFTKAVVIDKPTEYISSIKPHIRPNEFEVLKSINSYTIEQKMRQYIKEYKKAKQHINITRNRNIVKFSTLQYFEDYI